MVTAWGIGLWGKLKKKLDFWAGGDEFFGGKNRILVGMLVGILFFS